MSRYSIAEAKNGLPRLIDMMLEGEEVVITRHGRPVAELRPHAAAPAQVSGTGYQWLKARRMRRSSVGIGAVELLDRMYEER